MDELQIEKDQMLKKIREEVLQKFSDYKKLIFYMSGDAPISTLCLPKTIENILINNNFLRIYDLVDRDFTKIKGLGEVRVRDLTTRLDQFLSMF